MPAKKRDKDELTKSTPSLEQDRDMTFENENMFLQAFDKPTHIYRYLRIRNLIMPIFLNRTLSYMKHRMSRNNKRRATFKINNMLEEAEKTNKTRYGPGNYLSLKFIGFFFKAMQLNEQNNFVRVETVLVKIFHKKRKDSSTPYIQETFGSCNVFINPVDDRKNSKVPAISIPTEKFSPKNCAVSYNHSYVLLLRVEEFSSKTNQITCDDPKEFYLKRQKSNVKLYASELVIFDKHSRCLLSDGEYELALSEISTSNKNSSPKKHATWESIPNDMNLNLCQKFDELPLIKFFLNWTDEPCAEYVERPRQIQISNNNDSKTDALISNENETEKENSFKNNNNNYCGQLANNSTTNNSKSNLKLCNSDLNENTELKTIIFQFISSNNSRQTTSPSDPTFCPWCSLNCVTLYSLLKHLKLCHARFAFTYVPNSNGEIRIDVTLNDSYDGSYSGSPHDLLGPAGLAFARNGPVRRTSVTNLLVCRPRRPKPSLSEFLELDENELNNQRPYITGHNRLYHHTGTCLPIQPKELDIDSEGESDPQWLQYKTKQMIDEFTDVNEGEKELMKMWNLHIMKYGFVGDCQLPLACNMFLEKHGHELLQKNLYRNFVLHMCSLFDYGVVSPEVVYKTIQKLQNILSTYREGREIIAASREAQLNYWLNVGINKQQQEESKQVEKPLNELTPGTSSLLKQNLQKVNVANGNNFTMSSLPTYARTMTTNSPSNAKGFAQQGTNVLPRKRSSSQLQNESRDKKRRLSVLRGKT